MSVRSAAFLMFFALLMLSHWVVEPAYFGYLVAFALLIGAQAEWNGLPTRVSVRVSASQAIAVGLVLLAFVATINHRPAMRDLLRDVGALGAFAIGRWLFVAHRGRSLQIDALHALSAMGVMVSVVTIVAALLAFLDGASAYVWRGEYVPFAHNWIPVALIANVHLMIVETSKYRKYFWRSILCVCGTVAALSRTDLVLEIGFGLALAYRFRRELFDRLSRVLKLGSAMIVAAVVGQMMFGLRVVQERVEAGIGANDQSLGWRLMENLALVDHFLRATTAELMFGFGLGARMPLPPGILDFNNNTSIPHLHNSFGTIALKLGVMGLLIVVVYLWSITHRSFLEKDVLGEPYRQAGRWIVLISVGKAITLQGLSEWSMVAIFGIGCMLMLCGQGAVVVRPITSARLARGNAPDGASANGVAS